MIPQDALYYINEDQPMGPISSDGIDDMEIFKLFFDKQNKVYDQLIKFPSFIIGRRGSGKTAFLHSLRTRDDFSIIISIAPTELFLRVMNLMQKLGNKLVFIEIVADAWIKLFWLVMLNEASKLDSSDNNIEGIRSFIKSKGITDNILPQDLMEKILLNELEKRPIGFFDTQERSLPQAVNLLHSYLAKAQKKVAILIDSFEGYPLNIEELPLAFGGFMRGVAQFQKPKLPCTVRACLPAELYHILINFSSNPTKDFFNRALLHWHASELIRILAHRICIYYSLYHKGISERLLKHDISTKHGAKELFHEIFPREIANRYGGQETALGYLFRHTQLLPRHMLLYVSSIYRHNRLNGNDEQINPQAILSGIREVEDQICNDIIASYREVYPMAREVLENTLCNIEYEFSDATLRKVFNRFARKSMRGGDYYDFKRMLVEMGIVGKVIRDTDRHIIGLFEYTIPHKLSLSSVDSMCIHPVFIEVFNVKRITRPQLKTIYPYGSDVDGDEYRDF